MNFPFPLILASNSPRRQELLKNLGLSFTVRTKPTPENFPADMPADEVALYLAEQKARAFLDELDNELLIAADTTVVLEEEVLNKPASETEAAGMLRRLSASSHLVITGVCLLHKNKLFSFKDVTKVHFKKLEEQEITHYINHYQPFDKAGSYGIQEWIGMIGIHKIEGSYYNVMGLPVDKLYNHLKTYLL